MEGRMISWGLCEYQTGTHAEIPNLMGRLGIPCVLPLTEVYIPKAKKKVMRPALPRLVFIPAVEETVRLAMNNIRQLEKLWRDTQGNLIAVPNKELQAFLAGLERTEKKAKVVKSINLADATETAWKGLYTNLFGEQEAARRFGKQFT